MLSADEAIARQIDHHLLEMDHSLRVIWISSTNDLWRNLESETPGILLCDQTQAVALLDLVIQESARLRPELPVIAVGQKHTTTDAVTAISAGAQDFVSYEHPDLLRLVVQREMLRHRRLHELQTARKKLADTEERYHQLTETSADAIALVQEGIVFNANAAFVRLLGLEEAADLAGTPLVDLVTPESRAAVRQRIRSVHQGKHDHEPLAIALLGKTGPIPLTAQLILGTRDGESVIEMVVRSPERDSSGRLVSPITLGRNEFADALTPHAGESELARTAMLLRIDDFAALERRIGYPDAQDVTAQLTQLVGECLHDNDRLFLFSADELALLVERPDSEQAIRFAEQLLKRVSCHEFNARPGSALIRLTIAVSPLDRTEAPVDVIHRLVEQVRSASASGGNRIVGLEASMQARREEQEAGQRALQVRKALGDGRFYLAYQAIASLEGEHCNFFDVLLRMRDDAGKELQAAEFLPAARKFRLMPAVDRWVVSRVLDTIAARKGNPPSEVLLVKLSEETLREGEGFFAWLQDRLAGRLLKRTEIIFQLQELAIQNHVSKARSLCSALAACGAGVAIEHFGVGVNSLQLLSHIPVEFVKFHRNYAGNFADREIQKRLASLVEEARQRRIRTIVSHVEDARIMARLWQLGVNLVQGYHARQPEVVSLEGEHVNWGGDVTLQF